MSESLTATQYVQYCRREGLSPETMAAPYPHPYIVLWLECVKHADSMTGAISYPEPEKGFLGQDADLLLAFTIFEEYREEQSRIAKQREQVSNLAKEQGW